VTTDPLRDTLVDLALMLKPDHIELIVGGGYGLVLRSEMIAKREHFSRFGINTIVRSTGDLDCFLGAEVVSDSAKTRRIAEALESMGFTAIQRYWQFSKSIGDRGEIHIDLLAADVPAPLVANIQRPNDSRRFRPRGFDKLHGRRTPEAVTVQRLPSRVDASRDGRDAFVLIPHPLSFILMKLFAFRDRIVQADDDYGAYHAFDILQTIDSMNHEEWDQTPEFLDDPVATSTVTEAREIVRQLLSSPYADGSVRLIDYARSKQNVPITAQQLEHFVNELKDLLKV